MPTPSRKRTLAGFTLVELMIVVAIIGILAAIAIPAFSRYVKKSRTPEAVGALNRLWAGSVAYYAADHMDSAQGLLPRAFPGEGGSGWYEDAPLCGCRAGGKCPAGPPDPAAVWTGSGTNVEAFEALGFAWADPHNYLIRYGSWGTGTDAQFWASAAGDLDCDTTESTFQRIGSIDGATNDVTGGSAPYVDNELE